MCSLSYKGYPRGVEESHDETMLVSAIGNVLALRFCEGNDFYAFTTHFPSENEVKNLAQVRNSNIVKYRARQVKFNAVFRYLIV